MPHRPLLPSPPNTNGGARDGAAPAAPGRGAAPNNTGPDSYLRALGRGPLPAARAPGAAPEQPRGLPVRITREGPLRPPAGSGRWPSRSPVGDESEASRISRTGAMMGSTATERGIPVGDSESPVSSPNFLPMPLRSWIAALPLLFAPGTVAALRLYDVDFEAPFHTVGSPPSLDVLASRPRVGPVRASATNPRISSELGADARTSSRARAAPWASGAHHAREGSPDIAVWHDPNGPSGSDGMIPAF